MDTWRLWQLAAASALGLAALVSAQEQAKRTPTESCACHHESVIRAAEAAYYWDRWQRAEARELSDADRELLRRSAAHLLPLAQARFDPHVERRRALAASLADPDFPRAADRPRVLDEVVGWCRQDALALADLLDRSARDGRADECWLRPLPADFTALLRDFAGALAQPGSSLSIPDPEIEEFDQRWNSSVPKIRRGARAELPEPIVRLRHRLHAAVGILEVLLLRNGPWSVELPTTPARLRHETRPHVDPPRQALRELRDVAAAIKTDAQWALSKNGAMSPAASRRITTQGRAAAEFLRGLDGYDPFPILCNLTDYLARNLRRWGQYEAAIEALDRIGLEGRDVPWHTVLLHGVLLRDLERIGESLEAVRALARRDPKNAAVQDELAVVWIKMRRPDAAAAWVMQAYEETDRGGKQRPDAIFNRIRLASAFDEYQTVVEVVTRHLADAELCPPDSANRAYFLMLRGKAHRHLALAGDERHRALAQADLDQALAIGLAHPVDLETRLVLARIHTEAGDFDSAEQHIAEVERSTVDLLVTGEFIPSVLRAEVPVARSRVARGRGKGPDELERIAEDLGVEMRRRVEFWSEVGDVPGGVGRLLFEIDRMILEEWIRLCLAIDPGPSGVERALEAVLRLQAEDTLARRLAAKPPTVAEVRGAFAADRHASVLLYVPGRDAVHAFVLTADDARHCELATEFELFDLQSQYARLLETAAASTSDDPKMRDHRAAERRRAREIADALLPPELWEALRPCERWTIAGAETCGPPTLLWLPRDDVDFLGTRYRLEFVPSLPVGMALRSTRSAEKRGDPALDLVLVGAPQTEGEDLERWSSPAPLPLPDSAVDALTAPFQDERVITLRGARAAKRDLMGLPGEDFGVLAFLVHAVRDPSWVRPVGLLLASEPGGGDAVLRAEDLAEIPAVRLVVMPVCRSGVSPARSGDPGVTDLAGAWLENGTQSVVVAHTEQRLASTAEFVRSLLAAVAAGAAPSSAMRRAQEQAVDRYGADAPFHCGLVSVHGWSAEPIFMAPPTRSALRWGAALVAVVLAVLVFRRFGRRRV